MGTKSIFTPSEIVKSARDRVDLQRIQISFAKQIKLFGQVTANR